MLSFTIAVCLSLFMTSCIHYWIIPPTQTMSPAVQLALANGILANVMQAKTWKGVCIGVYFLLLLFGTLIPAWKEAWSSQLENEHVEQM